MVFACCPSAIEIKSEFRLFVFMTVVIVVFFFFLCCLALNTELAAKAPVISVYFFSVCFFLFIALAPRWVGIYVAAVAACCT